MPTTSTTSVSVLGLGAMGTALAHAFHRAGHRTTVWNRNPSRAEPLVQAGMARADDPADAIARSDLTVICVLDRHAVEAVLHRAGDALQGATVVNLTSSTPDDARAIAAIAETARARYLDGKIMVPTPLIGTDDSLVLYSGERAVFDDHRATLAALGGDADFLGDDHGLAALYDLGMLDVFFAGMTSFLHAAALVGADGVEAKAFLPYAERIVSLLQPAMAELAADVDSGAHPGHADNLVMEHAALSHIVSASAVRGIDTAVPQVPRQLVEIAIARGHGRDGFSRVVDVLRGTEPLRQAS